MARPGIGEQRLTDPAPGAWAVEGQWSLMRDTWRRSWAMARRETAQRVRESWDLRSGGFWEGLQWSHLYQELSSVLPAGQ